MMTRELGIVCGLTGDKPAFENECPDFSLDQASVTTQTQHEPEGEDLDTGLKIVSFCFPIVFVIHRMRRRYY